MRPARPSCDAEAAWLLAANLRTFNRQLYTPKPYQSYLLYEAGQAIVITRHDDGDAGAAWLLAAADRQRLHVDAVLRDHAGDVGQAARVIGHLYRDRGSVVYWSAAQLQVDHAVDVCQAACADGRLSSQGFKLRCLTGL